jgi:cell division protein FtsB
MAISTQTEALLDLYNQKLSLDTQQLSQINTIQSGYTITTGIGATDQIKIWGPTEIIENYNAPIKNLDNRIIELNAEIQNLQTDLLDVKQTANANGCPGFVWIIGLTTTTVLRDNLNYKGYTYTAPNPFSATTGTLTEPNSGIGTFNYVTQSVLGSYLGPISDVGGCAVYASQIENLETQIVGLQSSRNSLIEKVNFLKSGRSTYELQNYAYNQSIVQTNQSISNSNTIISFLEDPQNAEWL